MKPLKFFSCVLLCCSLFLSSCGHSPDYPAARTVKEVSAQEPLPEDPAELLNTAREASANKDYERASLAYEAYRSKVSPDAGVQSEYGFVLLYRGKVEEAEKIADSLLSMDKRFAKAVILKADCLKQKGLEEDAKVLLYECFRYDKTNKDILYAIIDFHRSKGDERTCAMVYEDYLKTTPDDYSVLIDLAYCQMNLGDYDKARNNCDKAINLKKGPEAYNALGNAYGNQTFYRRAFLLYSRAFELDHGFEPARTNMLWALFMGNRYEDCIKQCEAFIALGFENYEAYYYLGRCHEALNRPQEAINAYTKAQSFEYGDYSDLYYHIGFVYYSQRDFTSAAEFIRKALSCNPRNEDALWLIKELESRTLPLANRLGSFIKEHYLYQSHMEDFVNRIVSLNNASTLPDDEVVELAYEALHPQDQFSYLITGADYEAYMKEKERPTVFHSTENLAGKSYELFRIEAFQPMTGKDFIRLADRILHKEQKTLVIDLRGNTGGDMKASSEILDYLLDDCATVNFTDRQGYVSSYYSDADFAFFKKIIILADNRTASASELLILGLKVYRPEAILIGDTTFGKGVSQLVFDDPEHKVALCLVNSYWNVREININGYGIQPDKTAKTKEQINLALQDALDVVQ